MSAGRSTSPMSCAAPADPGASDPRANLAEISDKRSGQHHIRIPEDEGFTISEAERFRYLLDKQITVARSMSDGEENTRRFRN
jgi:hypothetical protein